MIYAETHFGFILELQKFGFLYWTEMDEHIFRLFECVWILQFSTNIELIIGIVSYS